ncbi:hypothetical protein A9R05_40345 (plasmid) [Burkholderia sp. KK1]|uniref:Uncharacterized protein n=2 Tax=Caballeronia grimmiae TaxID=1071679 RepID=A0A069NMB4_9BURK|nr:hypothetical protein A9R05_40345 [Burkholderia sp. KK1]KDR29357.1 hypothetical protein BG57_18095 [Caballeronia grimmiae]
MDLQTRHGKQGPNMSPIQYIVAAYRLRNKLAPQLFTLLALGAILTYHAMTSPQLSWLLD